MMINSNVANNGSFHDGWFISMTKFWIEAEKKPFKHELIHWTSLNYATATIGSYHRNHFTFEPSMIIVRDFIFSKRKLLLLLDIEISLFSPNKTQNKTRMIHKTSDQHNEMKKTVNASKIKRAHTNKHTHTRRACVLKWIIFMHSVCHVGRRRST